LALCKYLNNRKAYTVLLDFQRFMQDFVRAGLTCIHLFHEYSDFNSKITYLEMSKDNLHEGLARIHQPIATAFKGDSLLNEGDITKYIKTVNLQLEVTKYLFSQVKNINPGTTNSSLFANVAQKAEIAEQILVLYSFDLAVRVITDFRLPAAQIYLNAISKISRKKQPNKALDMLKSIKGTVTDAEFDEVVLASIAIFARENADIKSAEKFLPKIVMEENQINGNILCTKLKAAYLTAIKFNMVTKVKEIRDEAAKTDQKALLQIIDQWLAKSGKQ